VNKCADLRKCRELFSVERFNSAEIAPNFPRQKEKYRHFSPENKFRQINPARRMAAEAFYDAPARGSVI
jgi:hypothetical protein